MFQCICSQLSRLFHKKTENRGPSIVKTNPSIDNIWEWSYNETVYKIYYKQYNHHPDTPNIILIHGFGTSMIHWRSNLKTLSYYYNVFAFDLLGSGASDKPLIDYTIELWQAQTTSFVKKIYQQTGQPMVLIGNNLGGLVAIHSAIDSEIKSVVKSVVLIHPFGIFKGNEMPFIYPVFGWMLNKVIIGALYYYFKTNVHEILLSLYPYHPERVDTTFVRKIQTWAEDPNAGEIFYRTIKSIYPATYTEDLLAQLEIPLYMIAGKKDPWLQPTIYENFLKHYPKATGTILNAGYFPQDEVPEQVNPLILQFVHYNSVE